MIPLGPHAAFILAAYVAALVIVTALIGWVSWDYSEQQRILREFDRRGVKRRSAARKKDGRR